VPAMAGCGTAAAGAADAPPPDRLARARCLMPLLGHVAVRLASIGPALQLICEATVPAAVTWGADDPDLHGADPEPAPSKVVGTLGSPASEVRLAAEEVLARAGEVSRFVAELAELCGAEGQWLAILALAPRIVRKFGDDFAQLAAALDSLAQQLDSASAVASPSDTGGVAAQPSATEVPGSERWEEVPATQRPEAHARGPLGEPGRIAALRALVGAVGADLKADLEAAEPLGSGRLGSEMEAAELLRGFLLPVGGAAAPVSTSTSSPSSGSRGGPKRRTSSEKRTAPTVTTAMAGGAGAPTCPLRGGAQVEVGSKQGEAERDLLDRLAQLGDAGLTGVAGRPLPALGRELEAAKQYYRVLLGSAVPPLTARGAEPRLPVGGRDTLVSETQASGGSALHRWIRAQVAEPQVSIAGRRGCGQDAPCGAAAPGGVDGAVRGQDGEPGFMKLADVPHEFLCPITQDVMRDAVSTCDGHTYERRNIEAWLAENSTSPITGLPLANKTLIPNHNLRKLILDSGVLSRLEPDAKPDVEGPQFRGKVCCEIVVPRDSATLSEALHLGAEKAAVFAGGSGGGAKPAGAAVASASSGWTAGGGGGGRPTPSLGGHHAPAAFGVRLLTGEHRVEQTLQIDQEVEIVGSNASATVLRLSVDALLEFRGGARLANVAVCRDAAATVGSRGGGSGCRIAPLPPRLGGGRAPALIEVTQGSCRIEQCDLSNAVGSAIRVGGAHTSPTIARNVIHGCLDTGVVFKEGADGSLSGNRLFGNSSVAIEVHSRADPLIEDNDVFDGLQGGIFVYSRGKGHLRRNKIFRNALEGVEIKQGGRPLVEDNDIYDNLECGIFIHEGGEGRVIGNRIHSNSYAGIEIKDASAPEVRGNDVYSGRTSGMYVHSGGHGVIEGNQIHQNWLHGVYVRSKGGPHLLKNNIFRNDECGVFVTESSHPCIEHNEVHLNGLAGIEVKEESNPTIKLNRIHEGNTGGIFVLARGRGRIFENKLYKNKLEGIEIKDGGDPQVTDNEIYENLECGVFAHDGALGRIEGNRIFSNAYAGVEIKDTSSPVVKKNKIFRGHTSGVYVHSGGRGKVLENEVYENGLHGVMILSGGNPWMSGNRVHDNAECGVVAHVSYALDTTGNQVFANRIRNVQVVKN